MPEPAIPTESPPTYEDSDVHGEERRTPFPSIRFSEAAREREEASRYGAGARLLREQQHQRQQRQRGEQQEEEVGLLDNSGGEDSLDLDDEEAEVSRQVMEAFEVDDTSFAPAAPPTPSVLSRATVVSARIVHQLNSKLLTPVQRVLIDPVAKVWNGANQRFDDFLSRFGNPLMYRRLLYLLIVAFSVFAILSSGIIGSGDSFYAGQFHDHVKIRQFLAETIDAGFIRDRLEYMSSMSHMAGTAGDLTLAHYVQEEFGSFGMLSPMLEVLPAYITYPDPENSKMQLRLIEKKGADPESFEASIWEDPVYDNPSASQQPTRPYHALSPAGEAEGPIMYANFGTEDDYREIDVNGAIVFMRYGKMAPGLKVKLAESKGAKAVVMFPEKKDKDLKGWPDGPDYADGSFQRADVGISAIAPGDILTPGWTSMNTDRLMPINLVKTLPVIPSLPISWKQAEPFLKSIKGQGRKVDQWNNNDHPKLDEWWTGDKDSRRAYLKNEPIVKERHGVWDVFAKIEGIEQPEKAIIIGAQRDSYCYGAVEPTSSTAVLLELARAFTVLSRKTGWAPLRSLYFASWDASEHNYAGSTEWLEYNANILRENGVIYIDINSIYGPDFAMTGHPALEKIMFRILDHVRDPVYNNTLSRVWNSKRMPTGSSDGDQLGFSAHAGMPTLTLGFEGKTFPRHSCFDTFEWMKKFGDPDFEYHKRLAEVAAYVLLEYSDAPILEFDLGDFGARVHDYIKDLKQYADTKQIQLDYNPLVSAADSLINAGMIYGSWIRDWLQMSAEGEPPILEVHRKSWNSKVTAINSDLIDLNGLPERNFFKNTVFGPQLWHPTDGKFDWETFPGVRDAIALGNAALAQEQLNIAAQAIRRASARTVNV